ncbi:MAG: DUF948 domain-containing protein [Bacillota bacterium]
MNNVISFTLKDIGLFAIWGLLIIILCYIIVLLKSVYMTVKDFRKIIDENNDNVDKVLKQAPELTKNITKISKEVGDAFDKFNPTINNVAETSKEVTDTINKNNTITKEITAFFQILNTIISRIKKFLNKDKESKDNEKNNL